MNPGIYNISWCRPELKSKRFIANDSSHPSGKIEHKSIAPYWQHNYAELLLL